MKSILPALLALGLSTTAFAHSTTRPDAHAPLGLMGEHTHKAGEWMLSYRYGHMAMEQNRANTDNVSDASVLANFMAAPTDMDMNMHMFGAMYAPSDEVTLMAMLPYTEKSMNHITRTGMRFGTESDGIGDAKLGALIPLWDGPGQHLHLNAGVSLPTGSINEKDQTPMGYVRLPYPMQLGSGTFDLTPSLTYRWYGDDWSFGSQLRAAVRLGRNDNNYSLGNEVGLSTWGAYRFNDIISTSLRLDGSRWGDIDGADSSLNPMMVPTARADLRGGRRIDGSIGVNLHLPEWDGQRFAVELGTPLYEKLDGPQLSSDWKLTAGWQYAF
jgi:hypothetical protein